MLYYNLLYAFRGLSRNKLFTLLNLTGFSIGLAACMVLAIYIYQENTMNQCYPHHQRIYQVENGGKKGSYMDYTLAEQFKNNFPDVERTVIMEKGWHNYAYSAELQKPVKIEDGLKTNNDFFSAFSVPVLAGNPQEPFVGLHSVVLTRSFAQQMFGNIDVVGQKIEFGNKSKATITAVVEDLPKGSSLKAQLFFNFESEPNQSCDQYGCCSYAEIYLQLAPDTRPEQLTQQINNNFPPNNSRTTQIKLSPLANTYLPQEGSAASFGSVGNVWLMRIYLSVALAILLLSVVNYINFAISHQLSTLRHAGVRLAAGASLGHLRGLHLTEVAVMVLLSTLFALVLALLSLPLLSSILDTALYWQTLLNPLFILIIVACLAGLIMVVALAPLYIIARVDINSLFGRSKLRLGKQRVTNTLTVLQMIISIVLLSSMLIIHEQVRFVKQTHPGFEWDQLVALRTTPRSIGNLYILKTEVDQLPFVVNSSCNSLFTSDMVLRNGTEVQDEQGETKTVWMMCLFADQDFQKTFMIPIDSAQTLNAAHSGAAGCYIGKEVLRQTGWQSLEGKRLNSFIAGEVDVVGVMGDFHAHSMHQLLDPVYVVFLGDGVPCPFFQSLTVRLAPGNTAEQMAQLEKLWNKVLPNEPFDYVFYDELFDSFYRKEQRQAQAITLFSVIALVITCMGLLGQVFQAALARVKEIGVRKVNGATRLSIMMLFGQSLLLRTAVAMVLAVPIAYYAMHRWLQAFAYKVPLSWWIFALAGLGTLLVAALTVGWISWRAANVNPSEALKTE